MPYVNAPVDTSLVNEIVEYLGGVTVAAEKLEVPKTSVCMWKRRGNFPAHKVRLIEGLTGGEYTAEELRPDVFYPA